MPFKPTFCRRNDDNNQRDATLCVWRHVGVVYVLISDLLWKIAVSELFLLPIWYFYYQKQKLYFCITKVCIYCECEGKKFIHIFNFLEIQI